jgi:hypothetical protein
MTILCDRVSYYPLILNELASCPYPRSNQHEKVLHVCTYLHISAQGDAHN